MTTVLSHNFSPSSCEVRRVKKVLFSILSPEEITRMSAVEITSSQYMENDRPKEGGLLDPRMGTVDFNITCLSCGGDMTDCPGHFGHIKLAKPVFHLNFLNTIVKVLQCVCYQCSMLKVTDPSKLDAIRNIPNAKERFKRIHALCRGEHICKRTTAPGEDAMDKFTEHGGCGSVQPKYNKSTTKEKGLRVVANFEGIDAAGQKKYWNAEEVLRILKKISDEDCHLMGFDPRFAHPAFMILTVLPVPPPQVRPSIKHNISARSEDDITHKLKDIININSVLLSHEEKGSAQHQLEESQILLEYNIATMMDNTQPGLATATDKSKRPLKSIRERLKGKEGRVRGNLMGKRVDFSARTVITADPNLAIDQLGVPRSVAMNLTFGEVVTPLNTKRLHELVINGPLTHPGAKFVVRSDGVKIDLKYAKVEDIRLKDGDIVERHLQDEDCVLFNRQPTLHKMSMMGHRVKVMPYSTFRLNLSVTSPYNADFDGDEMNLHLPQSMITKAELMELMMVPKNILSAQANRPVIAIVQDSLLGSVLLTRRDVFLTRDLMMNCLMHLDDMFDGKIPQPAILKPKPLWTGKQLFTLLIPVVNLVKYSKAHEKKDNVDEDISPGDTKVIINQGELVSGICDKNVLGTSGGSLIHVIMKEHNSDVARDFLGTLQRVVNYWLLQHGFTIGFGDTIADEVTSQEISRTIQEAKDQVNNLVQKAQIGELKLKPGRTLQETFEHEVNVVLNEARNKAGNRASNSLSHHNNVKAMVVGGSKGTPINISQMIACVTGDTQILLGNGYDVKPIEKFGTNDRVVTVDPETRKETDTAQYNYFQLDVNEHQKKLYRVTVSSGRQVIATGDHPFLVYDAEKDSTSWIKAEDLTVDDLVVIRPTLEPLPHEVVSDEIILSEAVFRETLSNKTGFTQNKIDKYVNEMKSRGLLPLHANNPHLPLLAKILGHVHTDGSMSWGDDKTVIRLKLIVGNNADDVTEAQRDLAAFGVTSKPITSTNTQRDGAREYTQTTTTIETKAYLAALMFVLGAPIGQKTTHPSEGVPRWVQNGSMLVKREFIGAFIGGDGGSIKCLSVNETNKKTCSGDSVNWTRLRMTKSAEHAQSLRDLLQDVLNLCSCFGVTGEVEREKYNQPDGKQIWGIHFQQKEQNVLNFLNRVGYRYSATKREKSVAVHEWLRHKEHARQLVRNFRIHVLETYKDQGFSATEAMRALNENRIGKKYTHRNIHNIYTKEATYRQVDHKVTLKSEFLNYEELSQHFKPNQAGTINLPVTSIEIYDPNEMSDSPLSGYQFVYDFTTVSDNHSFIANGFVTHNCVGQQNVEGKRIPAKFRHRTLPHFKQYDYGPETRGFVANSYLRGLTPQEFYFHAMGGREGIIDTAVKTSETGYIQRRLIKSMEDAKVQYDGTVRDSEGNVLQFLYGEDGMDGTKLEFQFFKILTDSDTTFDYKYKYELDEHGGMLDTFGGNYMSSKVLESFQRDPEKFSILQEEYEQLLRDREMLRDEILYATGDEKICQPVNLDRLILTAQKLYNIDMRQKSDLDPCDVIENITELCKELIIIKGTDELSREAQNNATLLFKMLLRSKLASKRVLRDHRLTEEAFQWVLGEILDRFMKAHAQPGEMCGALAAQSIGEPATQMTLNTFHFAGVSSKNVTLGVPRLKELINVSKNIKTPQLTVYLSESHRHDNEKAKEVQSQLEYTTLGTITAKSEIFYDPNPRDTVIPEDQQFVEDFYSMPDHEFSEENLSPWLLRLELDYNMVTDKNLKMDEIGEKIMKEFDQHIICIATDDNAEKLVLRIRQIRDEKDKLEGENASEMEVAFLRGVEEQLLNAMPLRGIPDIKKVFLRDVKTKVYTNQGQRVRDEWVLDTEGINIQAVMAENNIDFKRTISNDINEILEVFGIEACRRMLLDELRKVIEFDDSYVNYRHLSMLVDVMTQKGELMPITRHGVGKSDQVGPLGRCTFEQSVEVILEASQFAMTDSLRSVSANIMLGQTAPIGTGSFDLFLDESQLKNAISMDSYALTSGEFAGNYTPSDSYAHTTFGGATPFTPGYGGATPFGQGGTPFSGNMTPFGDGQFSPAAPSPVTDSGSFSPYQQSPFAPSPSYDSTNEFSPSSPNVSSPQHFSPSSPSGYATSPVLSPSSPNMYSPSGATSPQSPAYQPDARYSPSSPDLRYSPSSPQFQSPASPSYSPSSPAQYASPSSPSYSPTTSPAQGYTTSPVYSPSSPANYSSPQSPQYSPSSPAAANYSPSSPAYGSPSSPTYSPSSPAQYSPASPQYSPSSPAAPNYSPSSPAYASPSSPSYSPSSPAQYSPQSPQYSPSSPRH